MNFIEILFILLFLHFLGDFALQSDAMAKGKNWLIQRKIYNRLPEKTEIKHVSDMSLKEKIAYEKKWDMKLDPNYPEMKIEFRLGRFLPNGQKFKKVWFYWLSAHVFIQGGLIYVFFPILPIILIEVAFHFLLDFLKCSNVTNFHMDQGFHILLRIIYAMVIFYV